MCDLILRVRDDCDRFSEREAATVLITHVSSLATDLVTDYAS